MKLTTKHIIHTTFTVMRTWHMLTWINVFLNTFSSMKTTNFRIAIWTCNKSIFTSFFVLFHLTYIYTTTECWLLKSESFLKQEAQLSPRNHAMRHVHWNLANCHATVQKLLIRQVLTKSMVWSWRFNRRQCVTDNMHSTMTQSSQLPLSQVS